jgi:hypothetical protein
MKTPVGWSTLNETPAVGSPLLMKAASILAQEAARFPASFPQLLAGTPAHQPPALPNVELPVTALPGIDVDQLRRYAHDMIETLLTALSPKAGTENRVALLHCPTPVVAGSEAVVSIRIANEDPSPTETSLYSTNFVSDTGYDIPARSVTFSPRASTIPAKSDATFELKARIPQQAPPGIYSGLVQAAGSKYLKAVVSIEVK